MHVIKLTLIQLIFIKLYIVISNDIVILIKLVELGDGEAAGHQERTQSDPHQPQVSVPLISRPGSATERVGPLPYEEFGWGIFRYVFSSFRIITCPDLGVLFSITCSVGVHVMGRTCSFLLFVVCRSEYYDA